MLRLSYSQRSCVIFSKLTFVWPHLLILDEPTNFLDLESVDALIAACNKYKGALLLVSHNRDFLKKCAKQYLSVVPGSFRMYDNLKEAEQGTYSFIAEMEEGGKISGADALANNPGGGSVHSSQKVGAAAAAATPAAGAVSGVISGVKNMSVGGAAAPAAKPATQSVSLKAGDKVLALWAEDGKHYPAEIKKIEAGGKVTVLFTEYGNTAVVTAKDLKRAPAAAPAKPAAATASAAKPAAAATKAK